MQTTPGNEKGRHATNVTTPMQTRRDCGADHPAVPTSVTTPVTSAAKYPQPPVRNDSTDSTHSTKPRLPRLTPRNQRLLLALLDGPKTRESVDRITGASNGPDEVGKARRKFTLVLPCVRKGARDRDGHRVEVGIYSLAPTDRDKAVELVKGAAQ